MLLFNVLSILFVPICFIHVHAVDEEVASSGLRRLLPQQRVLDSSDCHSEESSTRGSHQHGGQITACQSSQTLQPTDFREQVATYVRNMQNAAAQGPAMKQAMTKQMLTYVCNMQNSAARQIQDLRQAGQQPDASLLRHQVTMRTLANDLSAGLQVHTPSACASPTQERILRQSSTSNRPSRGAEGFGAIRRQLAGQWRQTPWHRVTVQQRREMLAAGLSQSQISGAHASREHEDADAGIRSSHGGEPSTELTLATGAPSSSRNILNLLEAKKYPDGLDLRLAPPSASYDKSQ